MHLNKKHLRKKHCFVTKVRKKGGQKWGIFCFRKFNNFELGHLIEMLIIPCKDTPLWKFVSWIHFCFPFMIFINFPYLAKHIMK